MHLHVDACYGGAAVLAGELRPLLAGIERADSIAVDAHKWLYTPLLGGCVLVRDRMLLPASFTGEASYIWLAEDARQGHDLAMHGPDFSRSFAALRIWLSLLAHGTGRLRAPHRPRRRAGPLSGRARGGAPRVRADDPRLALDLLLPLRARSRSEATRRRSTGSTRTS